MEWGEPEEPEDKGKREASEDPEVARVVTRELKDIATVKREYISPPSNLLRYNGRTAINMGISTASGGNVVDMGSALMQ